MRWEIRLSQEAVAGLYKVERSLVANVWNTLRSIAEDLKNVNLQASEEDPSEYWVAVEGDIILWLEILDEDHAIRLLEIVQ
jgi:hypothetical protein